MTSFDFEYPENFLNRFYNYDSCDEYLESLKVNLN